MATVREAMERSASYVALWLLLTGVVLSMPPTRDTEQFEAAFQGRCGSGSPCEQLCRELHDGTFECGCTDGFVLHVDGYGCLEVNTTGKALQQTSNMAEDVLYEKDVSFSAELDTSLVTDNLTTIAPEQVLTAKPTEGSPQRMEYDNKGQLAIHTSNDSGEKFKEIDGMKSLFLDGVSRNDINMIADEKDFDPFFDKQKITTLGPSLEQKVPTGTVSPAWTAAVGDMTQGCPLGRTGPNCMTEARIRTARFSGLGWVALRALRGAYKRVRLSVRVRPERARGVLLLTGERADLSGDYLALLLRDGRLELRFDCGSGAGVLRSPQPVKLGRWNTVSVYRHRWDAWLRLNNGRRVRGRSKGLFSRMTFREPVWVGGTGNTTGLMEKLGLDEGLVGCVDALTINGQAYRLLSDAMAGTDVSECAPALPHWKPDSTQQVPANIRSFQKTYDINELLHLEDTGVVMRDVDHDKNSRMNELSNDIEPLYQSYSQHKIDEKTNKLKGDKINTVADNARYYGNRNDYIKIYEERTKGETSRISTGIVKTKKYYNYENQTAYGKVIDAPKDACHCLHEGACVEGVCLCPLGYAGIKCDVTLDLKVPRFNGSSYLKLPGLDQSAAITLEIKITLKTNSGQGLILYNADQSEEGGDFFSLLLRDYFVEFILNLGSGSTIIRSHNPIRANTWYRILASRHGRRVLLKVWRENTRATKHDVTVGTVRGRSKLLNLRQPLMLGGARPIPGSLQTTSFNGCVRQLIINEEELSVVSSALGGVNVDNCGEIPSCAPNCSPESLDDTPSYTNHDVHHKIVSKKGLLGKKLRKHRKHTINHDNYEKKYLERNNVIDNDYGVQYDTIPGQKFDNQAYMGGTYMQIKYMNPNDINWVDTNVYPSFNGKDSFIHIDDMETMKRLLSYTLDINIRFRATSPTGLLVWSGNNFMKPGDDFLSLAIENSVLVFRYDLGSGEVVIIANHTKVDDGLWHRARATRNRQAGVLEVDGLGSVGKVSPGKRKQLNTDNGLYIGGMPALEQGTLGRHKHGITGCVSQISLSGDFDIPLAFSKLSHTITNNVARCDT